MVRWYFAAAALLIGAVSVSHADYVIIRVVTSNPGGVMGGVNGVMGGTANVGVPPTGPVGGNPGFSGLGNGGIRGPMGGQQIGNPIGAMGQPPMPPPPVSFQKPGDYVTVVIDMTAVKSETVKGVPGKWPFLEHKWGKTAHYEDNQEITLQIVPATKLKKPSVQYTDRRRALSLAKDRGLDRYLELAGWCLEVGLPDNCIAVLNEIEKMAAVATGKIPDKVVAAMKAYALVKPIVTDEIVKKDKALAWKDKLRYSSVAISKHYALVHNSTDAAIDGIQRRLDALENNYKTFYLLFAIKGKALPAINEKLVALLIAEPEKFNKARTAFEVGNDLVSDGFYARQENLAILSPNRTDNASRNFGELMREIYRKPDNDRNELLKGKFPDLGLKKEEFMPRAQEAARAQMLVLVEQALREESELASATHEGALQLIAATNLVPRGTAAPEWLRFGLASLFEMPKGPFPGKNNTLVKLAFWPGAGGANWAWRRYLDEMIQDGSIPDQPVEQLDGTITDFYFDRARELKNAKPVEGAAETPAEIHANALAQARCLSWTLCHYLFTERFDEFMAFLTELGSLPRDVEIDPLTFVMGFCKAFKVDTTGLTAMGGKGQTERYKNLSREWIASVRRFPAPTIQLKLEDTGADAKK